MNKKTLNIIFQNGLWFGIALCLYSVFMWLTHLDADYLYIGQYLDILVILVPIFFIFRAIRQANQILPVGILPRLLIAVGVGLIGYLIHSPYLYVYHNVINPEWFDAVVALQRESLIAQHMADEQIKIKIQEMIQKNQAQNKIFGIGSFIASVLVLPLLICLLSFIFIRKTKNV